MDTVRQPNENAVDIFIKGWGRMGIYWGVGKVMAEIQALLYVSRHPLGLDEMSERLKTSRSNVSLNVRALQDLGVVRKVITPGDRKDYYVAEADLEKVARRLAAVKKRRELDPALDVVTRALRAAETPSAGNGINPYDGDGRGDGIDMERLHQLKDLVEKISDIFETFIDSDTARAASTEAAKIQDG